MLNGIHGMCPILFPTTIQYEFWGHSEWMGKLILLGTMNDNPFYGRKAIKVKTSVRDGYRNASTSTKLERI